MVEPLDQLREMVLGDPALCRSLVEITNHRQFTTWVAEVARQHGVALAPADIAAALNVARRQWLERWV